MAAKDGRFYLRLSDDERRMFDEVAEALGFGNTSDALRFIVREKHRELDAQGALPRKPKRSKKK